jgi:hypothetical protein
MNANFNGYVITADALPTTIPSTARVTEGAANLLHDLLGLPIFHVLRTIREVQQRIEDAGKSRVGLKGTKSSTT